jgi:hypothetical protein
MPFVSSSGVVVWGPNTQEAGRIGFLQCRAEKIWPLLSISGRWRSTAFIYLSSLNEEIHNKLMLQMENPELEKNYVKAEKPD